MLTYSYTTLDDPSGTGTEADDINDAGQIVGLIFDSSATVTGSFLYTNGNYLALSPWSISPPIATGINDAGQIVGSDNSDGFFYSGGNYTALQYPEPGGVVWTGAEGINDAGQIVGSYRTNVVHGFLYSSGSYITLDDPLATTIATGFDGTMARGINDAGQIVGNYYDINGV